MGSNKVSNVKLLFNECNKQNPDIAKIDEYINCCCNNKEDINVLYKETSWRGTTLHMACRWRHHEIVKRLLDKSNIFKFPIDVNAISDRC